MAFVSYGSVERIFDAIRVVLVFADASACNCCFRLDGLPTTKGQAKNTIILYCFGIWFDFTASDSRQFIYTLRFSIVVFGAGDPELSDV